MIAIEEIVAGGLCVGCGLCESIAGPDAIEIAMTPDAPSRVGITFTY